MSSCILSRGKAFDIPVSLYCQATASVLCHTAYGVIRTLVRDSNDIFVSGNASTFLDSDGQVGMQ